MTTNPNEKTATGFDKKTSPAKKAEDMLKGLGNDLDPKEMKKLIASIQKDPKMRDMMINLKQQLTNGNSSSDPDSSARDRLREKIKQQRMQRGGVSRQRSTIAKESAKKTEAENKLISQKLSGIKVSTTDQFDKFAKLQEKHGIITEERWTSALKYITDHVTNDGEQETPELITEKDIVELYTHQTKNLSEEKIDDDDEVEEGTGPSCPK